MSTGHLALGMIPAVMLDGYGMLCGLISQVNPRAGEMMSYPATIFGICFFAVWLRKVGGKSFRNSRKLILAIVGEGVLAAGPFWIIMVLYQYLKKPKSKKIIIKNPEDIPEDIEDKANEGEDFEEDHADDSDWDLSAKEDDEEDALDEEEEQKEIEGDTLGEKQDDEEDEENI